MAANSFSSSLSINFYRLIVYHVFYVSLKYRSNLIERRQRYLGGPKIVNKQNCLYDSTSTTAARSAINRPQGVLCIMTAPERPQPDVPSIDLEEYSASKTLIPFDQSVHLLRGPIKAGSEEETAGRFILAFKDPISWASAYKTCESQVTQQCESGARIGCSIAASDKCKTPWWKSFTGSASNQDFAERARCEEREMEACLEAAKGKCNEFAKQKCFPAFRDARIAVKGLSPKVNKKELSRLISWVNLGENCQIADLWRLERPWLEFKAQLEVSYCKRSDILGSDDYEYLRTIVE